MKRKVFFTSIIVALFAVIVGAIAIVAQSDDKPAAKKTTTSQSASSTQHTHTATKNYISYKGEDGKNALDLLKQHATVVTKDSQYGPFVESINGVKGENKYWGFYVNGQQASVGAAEYITKNGDKIEWKFE